MARDKRKGGSRNKSTITSSLIRLIYEHRLILSILVLIIALWSAFYIRYMPYKNCAQIVANIKSMGLNDVSVVARFDAMDPLIQYWLAEYLHQHGLKSWVTLHPPNPAVMKFWYPWGRDFTHTARLFIPLLGSIPPMNLSVAQWTSLIPVIFGILIVLVAFLYIGNSYGYTAATIAALLEAVLPAAIIRTYAGFVEKIGVAMPFLILAVWLFSEALKRNNYIISAISGFISGFIAFVWGGYPIPGFIISASTALAPLATASTRETRSKFLVGLIASISYALTLVLTSRFVYVSIRYAVLSLLIIIVFAAIYELLQRIVELRIRYINRRRIVTAYSTILVALGIAALFVAPDVGIGGHYYYALLGPLRGIFHAKLNVIEFTVAEYNPPAASFMLHRLNVLLFTTPIAGLYLLYIAIRRKETWHLPLIITALASYYVYLGMAYFEQVAGVFSILVSAALLGYLVKEAMWKSYFPSKKRGKNKQYTENREILVFSAILVAAILIAGVFAGAYTSIKMMENIAPIQLDMPNMNIQQYGWLYLLHLLRTKTPNNTVIVAWWDYGYLITVGSNRATVADGATLNNTQIKLLAKFFTTTNENKASNILRELHLKPNRTLIFVHEAVLYNPSTGAIIYEPTIGDIAKSTAMMLIAGVLKPGEKLTQQVINHFLHSMIYRMFVTAPYYMNKTGIVFIPFRAPSKGFNVTSVYVAGVNKIGKPYHFKHFKPYLVLLSPFVSRNGHVIIQRIGNSTYQLGIIYILYKWTG